MDNSKTNDVPIKWLKFLIYWRIPIGLLFNAISFNALIHSLPQEDLFSILFEIFYALMAIILPIITLAYCIQFKGIGYYLLKSSLIIEVVFNSAISSLSSIYPYAKSLLSDFFSVFIPLIVIFSVLWIYPNFIYLKNRKKIFINKEKTPNTNKLKKLKEKQKLEKLVEDKVDKKQEITFRISKKKLLIIISSLIIIILISIGTYFLADYINSLKDEILSYKQKYNIINNKYASLQNEYDEIELKLNFYDEHIVFVLEGHGNYYYTYDQIEQITQGNSYSYWAYNKEAAISQGYKAFSE